MQNRQGLIPTPITDKNGKQTTVYTKPVSNSKSSPSMPAPVVNNQRDSDYRFVSEAFQEVDKRNADKFTSIHLSNRVTRASANDIVIIAKTLRDNPEFKDILAVSAVNNLDWNMIVAMASVYDPTLPMGNTPSSTQYFLVGALNEAHQYIKGDLPDGGWAFNNEDAATQEKTKRFVSAWLIARSGEGVLSYDLITRMLDSKRTDHDEILHILRSNPDATIEQIDFILSGGNRSLSGGAL